MTKRSLVLVLLMLLGCASSNTLGPLPSSVPEEYYSWTPPAHFETWYAEVAECAGLPLGDFSSIRWFVVPGMGWNKAEDGTLILGLHVFPHDIYLADLLREVSWLAKHEMLHNLGLHGHPQPPFNDCEFRL